VLLALLAAAGIAGALATAGTFHDAGPPGTLDSVGKVDGTTALVAVLASGDAVEAYVCDGDTDTGERFSGSLRDGRALLRSPGGAQLDLALTGTGASGTFTAAGATSAHPFRTEPSTGPAGWYAARATAADGPAAGNWVVLADGTQTGIENIHKRKHRGPRLHPRPSGVSPKADGATAQPEEQPIEILDSGPDCARFEGRLCAEPLPEPVELGGDTPVQPTRVAVSRELAPLS
jgi:hypothetical protein